MRKKFEMQMRSKWWGESATCRGEPGKNSNHWHYRNAKRAVVPRRKNKFRRGEPDLFHISNRSKTSGVVQGVRRKKIHVQEGPKPGNREISQSDREPKKCENYLPLKSGFYWINLLLRAWLPVLRSKHLTSFNILRLRRKPVESVNLENSNK